MARVLHPRLSSARRAQLRGRGAALFHGGRHFAAHECWEEIWRSTTPEPRALFQGLVQLAAAFHHLERRRRPEVALRVLRKASRRLAQVEPAAAAREGIDLPRVVEQIAAWDRWLAAGAEGERPVTVRLAGD